MRGYSMADRAICLRAQRDEISMSLTRYMNEIAGQEKVSTADVMIRLTRILESGWGAYSAAAARGGGQ